MFSHPIDYIISKTVTSYKLVQLLLEYYLGTLHLNWYMVLGGSLEVPRKSFKTSISKVFHTSALL